MVLRYGRYRGNTAIPKIPTAAAASDAARSATDNRRAFVVVTMVAVGVIGLALSSAPPHALIGSSRSTTTATIQLATGSSVLLVAIAAVFAQRRRLGTEGGSSVAAVIVGLLALGSLDLLDAADGRHAPGATGVIAHLAAGARAAAVVLLGVKLIRWRFAEPRAWPVVTAAAIMTGLLSGIAAATGVAGRTPGGSELGNIAYGSGLLFGGALVALGLLLLEVGQRDHRIGEVWLGVLAVIAGTADLVLHHVTDPAHLDFVGGVGIMALGAALVASGLHNDFVRIHVEQTNQLLTVEKNAETAGLALEAERQQRAQVAHDGRSALLAIEGGIRYIADNHDSDPDIAEDMYLALSEELARLRRMLTRREVGALHHFAVNEAISPAIRLHAMDHRDIAVDGPTYATAFGEPDATREIVQNLLDNAIYHGREAGVSIHVVEWLDSVTITVTDDGPGVPEALHEAIFERGVSSKPDHAAGLGLYSSRELAKQMGGSLGIDPVARGASFTLTLPDNPVETSTDQKAQESPARLIDLRGVVAR